MENDVKMTTKKSSGLKKLDYYLAYDTTDHRQLSPYDTAPEQTLLPPGINHTPQVLNN